MRRILDKHYTLLDLGCMQSDVSSCKDYWTHNSINCIPLDLGYVQRDVSSSKEYWTNILLDHDLK